MLSGHRSARRRRGRNSRAARIAVPLAIPMALGLTLGVILAVSGGKATTIDQSALGSCASRRRQRARGGRRPRAPPRRPLRPRAQNAQNAQNAQTAAPSNYQYPTVPGWDPAQGGQGWASQYPSYTASADPTTSAPATTDPTTSAPATTDPTTSLLASATPCASASADPTTTNAVVPPAATFANGQIAFFPLGDLATDPVDGTGAAINLNQTAVRRPRR